MAKLNFRINHQEVSIDITEVSGEFEAFDYKERKEALLDFKNKILKALGKNETENNSLSFKVPFEREGYIELMVLSDNPIHCTFVLLTHGEFEVGFLEKMIKVFNKISSENPELLVASN